MSFHEARCDRCCYRRRLYHILRYYRLEGDDCRITIREAFAWCRDCRQVLHAERLENLVALETELEQDALLGEEVYSAMAPFCKDWRKERDRHLSNLRRRIDWRRSWVS